MQCLEDDTKDSLSVAPVSVSVCVRVCSIIIRASDNASVYETLMTPISQSGLFFVHMTGLLCKVREASMHFKKEGQP